MKKLNAIYFKFMPLTAHLRYHEQFNTRLTAAGDDLQEAVAPELPPYRAALTKERNVADWVRKSELTKDITNADTEVDRLLVGINSVVQAGRHSSMSAIKASGERVYHMLQELGDTRSKSYDKKAGDVEVMLRQYGGDYAQDVSNLGMAMWVQQLQTAFNAFVALLSQRSDEQMEKPPYTAEEVRKEIEESYRRIVYIIDANAATSASADFATFIDHLNPEIERINAEFHRAKKDLSQPGCTLIAPIGTQEYTGNPVTPLSDVYYTPPVDDDEEDDSDRKKSRPTERLYLGRDYEITYKNNINVGQAQLIVHGKGDYKGQKSIAFYIARKPFPTDGERENGERENGK